MQTPHPSAPILLVGHRGTGKTTLAPLLAKSLGEDWSFVDLDAEIERAEGKTPAAIIAEDEATFRRIESRTLSRILNHDSTQTVIAAGAGCQMPQADALEVDPLFIWLWRDGWVEEAKDKRARLRADLSFEEEVRWMRDTREPGWAAVAHLFFQIPRARTPDLAARMLADYTRWSFDAPDSAIARRSWLVPTSPEQLERARHDARLFGLAGVEMRSDLCAEFSAQQALEDTPILASLRTRTPEWLEAIAALPTTHTLDIDLEFLEAVRAAKTLARITPRTLLLSTHPEGVGQSSAEELLRHAEHIREDFPQWAAHIHLKYAPSPTSFVALRRCFAIATTLQSAGYPTTFLPQGERFAWTRPILANPAAEIDLNNSYNYLPVGVRKSRLPAPNTISGASPSPMDLQDWLPHFARLTPNNDTAQAEHFDGLIGNPIRASIGDWWHTQAAIAAQNPTRYLKIQLGRDEDEDALKVAFRLFADLGLRGLSVTSPMKQRIHPILDDAKDLPVDTPLNTLLRTDNSADNKWTGRDTDEFGMLATLRQLMAEDEADANPKYTVSIIGRGGVSPAILRAVETAGWTLVEHASAREGWKLSRTHKGAKHVRLVINAAGARAGIEQGAPACEVWLDLHYSDVAPKPACAQKHLNGDIFFEGQAQAQRTFWESRD